MSNRRRRVADHECRQLPLEGEEDARTSSIGVDVSRVLMEDEEQREESDVSDVWRETRVRIRVVRWSSASAGGRVPGG